MCTVTVHMLNAHDWGVNSILKSAIAFPVHAFTNVRVGPVTLIALICNVVAFCVDELNISM